MLTIYIEEAHPADEWRLPESKVERELSEHNDIISTHQNMKQRLDVAQRFIERKGIKGDVVCDGMKGQVLDLYQAWPERLYIIVDGVVAYKGGVGPFHYNLGEVEAWLENWCSKM
jgi:type I thyroxine 5'-deiodinase